MTDANEIVVSFDEMRAVRVRDGARLEAVAAFARPDGRPYGACSSCQACSLGTDVRACSIAIADAVKHCGRHVRKDRRNITWVLTREETYDT